MTETASSNTFEVEGNGFSMISAKEKQRRDSIMSELYNEISSSDDEEDGDLAEPKASSPHNATSE